MEDLLIKLRMYGLGRFLKYSLYEVYLSVWMQGVRNSYSQGGEDIVIDKILGSKKKGFYVDVGANDPTRFSNTKRFYIKGWRGINIEPDPQCFEKIIRERKMDINLNIGIGRINSKMTFYKFIPNTLSTFSSSAVRRYKRLGYKLVGNFDVPVRRLSDILSEYAKGKEIDFISIDTEGNDIDVLEGNDWKKFRPKVICIESTESGLLSPKKRKEDIAQILSKIGYVKVFDNHINCVYIDKKLFNEIS